jgi:phosphoglycolate phosphatase
MIRCAVFDFDGTLVDSNDIKTETFFNIAHSWDPSGEIVGEVLRCWPSADRYEKTKKIAEGLISRRLLPPNASVEEWSHRLANEYTVRCKNNIACCQEMPGASQSLGELTEKGYLLFINSATPKKPLRQILNLRNWSHFFQDVYGAEATKADNLRRISRETGTTKNEIVHIGDQRDDLQATEQFGCHFIAMAAPNSGPIGRQNHRKGSPLAVQDLRTLHKLFLTLDKETP